MITIFCDFWQFSAKKLAFFSKTNVMIKVLHNLALFWVTKRQFFRWIFRRKYFKNHNIGPRWISCVEIPARAVCKAIYKYTHIAILLCSWFICTVIKKKIKDQHNLSGTPNIFLTRKALNKTLNIFAPKWNGRKWETLPLRRFQGDTEAGLPDSTFIYGPKIANWVNFGRPCNGRC
jgi:hypothetical protein